MEEHRKGIGMITERRYRCLWLPVLLLLLVGITALPAAYGAQGDPVYLFELKTEQAVEQMKPGDAVNVEVVMSRADGSQEPSGFYGVQLDIAYDGSLFEASQLKTVGPKRPDGENWKGSWSCNSVPGIGEEKQIRVLCTNLALAGGLENADKVPGAETVLAGFTLTVRQNVAVGDAQIRFAKVLNIGSDLKKTDAQEGPALTLHIAAGTAAPDGGTANGGDSGSGGSGSSGTGGSGTGGSGSGAAGSGGSSGSQSGTSGTAGSTDGTGGASGTSQTGAAKVRFEELTDAADHWAADFIRYAVEHGVASGNEFGQFQPDKSITRAEFCQMAANAFGYAGKTGTQKFYDVTAADWYADAVLSLEASGIVSGIGDGRFGAEQTLTRQDMAVILYRIMQDKTIPLTAVREYAAFQDEGQTAEYARQAVTELYCSGIISGTEKGELCPEASTTRAEVAVVMTKLLKEIEGR